MDEANEANVTMLDVRCWTDGCVPAKDLGVQLLSILYKQCLLGVQTLAMQRQSEIQ